MAPHCIAESIFRRHCHTGGRAAAQRIVALLAFLLAGVSPSAQGAVIVDAIETGGPSGDVVFSGSGSLNLDAWTRAAVDGEDFGRIDPPRRFNVGPVPSVPVDRYQDAVNFDGPSNFGLAGDSLGSSGSGDIFGLLFADPLPVSGLIVPDGYTSGDPLSGSTTYDNETFASLGVDIGSYTWTWGSGDSADSITLNIVPEPGTAALLGLGVAGLGVVGRSRRGESKATA